jgi:hypothetical protein
MQQRGADAVPPKRWRHLHCRDHLMPVLVFGEGNSCRRDDPASYPCRPQTLRTQH